jgi:hypothetical protein
MTEEQELRTLPGNPTAEISLEIIGVKAGFITCASLIIYFMIMRYSNFMDSGIAWGMNFIILLSGIILAYYYYRTKTTLNVDYIPGLILGSITTAASVIPFVLFVYIYFSQINPQKLLLLKDNILFMGEEITPMRAAVATMVEGLSSGVIVTFMMMQYFRSGFRRTRREVRMQG